ncbi:MAG: glycosyltransferase family 39 protein [Chloroflexota bacterium]
MYSYIGWGMLHGYPPYRDAWAQNAPGNFFVYAAAFKLLGETADAISLLGLAESLAGTAAVMVAARLLLGARYAALAGALYGLTAALGMDYRDRQEPEALMAVAVTLVVAVLVAAYRASRWVLPAWALAGALAAACTLLKPTGGVAFVLALAVPMILKGSLGGPGLPPLGAFGAGALVPVVATVTYLSQTGSLPYFYDQVVAYNLHYAGSHYSIAGVHSWVMLGVQTLLLMGPVPLLAVVGVWVAARRSRNDRSVRLVLVWGGITYLAVAVQGRHFEYHPYFALPAFSLLAAAAVAHLWEVVRSNRGALYATAAATAFFAVVEAVPFGPRLANYGAGIPVALGLADRPGYLDRFRGFSNDPQLRRPVADYLQQVSAPQDRIFAVGEPSIYFEAKRRAPTRLFQELPLWNAGDPKNLLDQISRDLASEPPRYMTLLMHHEPELFFVREQEAMLGVVAPLLAERYVLDRTIERVEIYRLKDG